MTLPLLQFEIIEVRPRREGAGQTFVASSKERVVIMGDELPVDVAIERIAETLRRARAQSMVFVQDLAQIDGVCEGPDSIVEISVLLMNLSSVTTSAQQRQEIVNQILLKASTSR